MKINDWPYNYCPGRSTNVLWTATGGCRTFMNLGTGFIFMVRVYTFDLVKCIEHCLPGFSRGAYQARTLAAMIHTVFVVCYRLKLNLSMYYAFTGWVDSPRE